MRNVFAFMNLRRKFGDIQLDVWVGGVVVAICLESGVIEALKSWFLEGSSWIQIL